MNDAPNVPLDAHLLQRLQDLKTEYDTGQKQLAAYIVPNGEHAPAVSALREHILATLPEYMVSAHFVALDTLPLTNNNKVDVARLPAIPQGTIRSK